MANVNYRVATRIEHQGGGEEAAEDFDRIAASADDGSEKVDQLTGALSETGEGAADASRGLDRADASASKFSKTAGFLAGLVATIGFSSLSVDAGQVGVAFDDSLTKVVTQVGIARDQVNDWRGDLIALGPAVGQGPVALADALFTVTSAGERGAGVLDILREAGIAASLGLGETAAIAKVGVAALEAYGRENITAAEAIEILRNGVRAGNLEAAELAPTLGRVTSVSSQMGVSFAETNAFIAKFTLLGGSAAEGVTGLRGTLNAFLKPAQSTVDVLTDMNTSIDAVRASIRERGLAATLSDLVTQLNGNQDAMGKLIPQTEALGAVLNVVGSDSGAKYVEIAKEVSTITGDMAAQFEEVRRTSPGQAFRDIGVDLEALKIGFSQGFLPQVRDAVRDVRTFIDANKDLTDRLGELVGKGLDLAVRSFKFLADHIELVVLTLGILLALKVVAFFTSTTVSIVKMIVKTLLLRGALAALQQQLLGVTAVGFLPFLVAVKAAVIAAAVSLAAFLAIILLTIAAGVAAGIAIKRWADRSVRDMDRMVAGANEFGAAIRGVGEDAQAAIRSSDLDRMSNLLGSQTLELERLHEQRDAAAAALERMTRGGVEQALVVEELAREGKTLSQAMRENEVRYNEANVLIPRLTASTNALKDAMREWKPEIEASGKATNLLGDGVVEAKNKMDLLLASLSAEAEGFDQLAAAALRGEDALARQTLAAQVEQQFQSERAKLAGEHADRLGELRAALERVALAEQKLAGAKIIGALQRQVGEAERVLKTYDQGAQAVRTLQTQLEREADVRDAVAAAAADQRVEIERLTRSLQRLAVTTQAAETAAALESQVDALGRIAAAYRDSSIAGEEVARQLEREQELHERIAPLISENAILTKDLAEKRALLALTTLNPAFQVLLAAEVEGILEALAVNEDFVASITARTAARNEASDSADAERFIRGLKDQTDLLRLEQQVLENSTLGQKLFGEATLNAAIAVESQRRILQAGVDPASEYADEIRRATEEELRFADSITKIEDLSRTFSELGETVSTVFAGIDEGLAETISALADAAAAFGEQAAAAQRGDIAGAIAAGAEGGQAIFEILAGLGLFQGNRGIGNLGGQLSGDLADVGAQAGGAAAGPIGALAGALLGGFIKRGADEALATLEQVGTELEARVDKVEGKLGPSLGRLTDSIISVVDELEALIGAQITTGVFGVKIRDDIVTVFINGIQDEFDTIEDAVAFAVSELLRTADISGATDRVLAVLNSGDFGTLEELESAIALAQALDDAAVNAGPAAAAFREVSAQRIRETQIAREHGLSMREVLGLSNRRIAALKAEVQAQFGALVGVNDYLSGVRQLEQSFLDVNRGIDAERAAREREIAALEQQRSSLAATAGAGGGLSNELDRVTARAFATTEAASDGAIAVGLLGGTMGDLSETGDLTRTSLEEVDQEIADLRASLEELPSAIDADQIAEAYRVAGSNAALDLIALLQQVQGEQFLVVEQQEIQATLYQIQLATQIAAVETLLASTELLDAATRSLFEGIVDSANEVLTGLTNGSINFNAPGVPRPSGGDTGVAQRQARRREIADQLADMREGLDLVAGGAQRVIGILQQGADLAEEMRRLSTFTQEQIDEALALFDQRAQLAGDQRNFGITSELAQIIGDQELIVELERQAAKQRIDSLEVEARLLHERGVSSDEALKNILDLVGRARDAIAETTDLAPDANPAEPDNVLEELARFVPSLAAQLDMEETLAFFADLDKRLAAIGLGEAEILALREEASASIVTNVFDRLARLTGNEEAAARATELKQQAELLSIRTMIALAAGLGVLLDADMELLNDLLAQVEAGFADGTLGLDGPLVTTPIAQSLSIADPLADLRAEIEDFVQAGQRAAEAVGGLNARQLELERTTARLIEQAQRYNLSTREITESFLAQQSALDAQASGGINDLLRRLLNTDAAGQASFAALNSELNRLLALAPTDLDARARLAGVADQALAAAELQFGTLASGAGLDFRQNLIAQLQSLPGVDPMLAAQNTTNALLGEIRVLLGGVPLTVDELQQLNTRASDSLLVGGRSPVSRNVTAADAALSRPRNERIIVQSAPADRASARRAERDAREALLEARRTRDELATIGTNLARFTTNQVQGSRVDPVATR